MRTQSSFWKISIILIVVVVLALGATGGRSIQVNAAQATMAATMSGTMAGTMGAMMDDGAMPPCPTGMMMGTPAMMATTAMMGTPAMMATAAMMGTPAMMATTAMMGTPGMAATMYVENGAAMGGCVLAATLSGAEEVPTAGDPAAKGTAMLMLSRSATGPGEVCFTIQIAGIKLPAAAAHIHKGAKGVAGPVVVPFAAPDAKGMAMGCTENVDRALIHDILTTPGDYYVNVHNADFPGGAARGQLAAAK